MITFGLLGISICAVWIQPIKIRNNLSAHPWFLLFISACASGYFEGYLKPIAIAALSLFAYCAYLATALGATRLQKNIFSAISIVLALALALHRIPGFNNPIILDNVKLSVDAISFTQYANFDKGAVGLILLAFFCHRTNTIAGLWKTIKQSVPIIAITSITAVALAMSLGHIRPDLKTSWLIPVFLATNIFFTVIAEEAFFRGVLQERMTTYFQKLQFGGQITIFLSALLFGLAHIAGGTINFLVAIIAGIGYAYAFSISKKIEGPILVHVVLNTVHFIGFTYPHIQQI